MTVTPRAVQLGKLLRSWRNERGLSRPELVAEVAKLGQSFTPDYLNKLEAGTRSLANASLDLREALRLVLGITRDEWKDKTNLHVPLEVRYQRTDLGKTSRVIPSFRLTVANGKGKVMSYHRKVFIDEDWEGEFEAYIVEDENKRFQTTIVIKLPERDDEGNVITEYMAGDEVLCDTPEHGTLLCEIVWRDGITYFLKPEGLEPFASQQVVIRGSVERKQEDRLRH